nr:DGQHR domain-containing protein [Rhodococcus sp. 06-1059B-a]
MIDPVPSLALLTLTVCKLIARSRMAVARSKEKAAVPRQPAISAKSKPVDPAVANQRRFAKSVTGLFENLGFTLLPTEGLENKFGSKTGELDSVFIYENILLIVEDTTQRSPLNHAKNKCLLAKEIFASKTEFVKWLRNQFPDYSHILNAYSTSRFKLFFLYISQNDMDLDDDGLKLLEPMTIVTPAAFSYFEKLAKIIRRSARTDFWRFLKLESNDIGTAKSGNDVKTIETTIISPEDNTDFIDGVRLVSFMISAETLLRNSYVLRKDNWGYSINLYQRMLDASRISKIRHFVANEGSGFLNNIIIGLPEDVIFQRRDKAAIEIGEIQDYGAYRMVIPDEFNSLCIIDGQHRVFAHYEGTDELEARVAAVRSKVHLLATGLIFPASMDELERMQLQSSIFVDINSNTKPVPPDVLLAIQSLREPFAAESVARRILDNLNTRPTFRGLFQLTQMDKAPIKIASIVRYALRRLVDIKSEVGLFVHWVKNEPSRTQLRDEKDLSLLEEYVKHCAATLDIYFGALKTHHKGEWTDSESKIISTTAINGMIIALTKSLPALGVLNFAQYDSLASDWRIDFSKKNFKYASSQYAMFSQDVLRDMFDLVEKDGEWTQST